MCVQGADVWCPTLEPGATLHRSSRTLKLRSRRGNRRFHHPPCVRASSPVTLPGHMHDTAPVMLLLRFTCRGGPPGHGHAGTVTRVPSHIRCTSFSALNLNSNLDASRSRLPAGMTWSTCRWQSGHVWREPPPAASGWRQQPRQKQWPQGTQATGSSKMQRQRMHV